MNSRRAGRSYYRPCRSVQRELAAGLRRLVAAACLIVTCLPLAAQESALKGRTLVDVISSFEEAGLVVYYSSDLIRPWMTVKDEPSPDEPVKMLDDILAPYQLVTRPGPQGGVLIVRQQGAADPTGSILGVVKNAATGRRVNGARVRLQGLAGETFTSPRGQFSINDLPAGNYTILVGHTDNASGASAVATVEPGEISIVQIEVETETVRQLESVVVSASRYDLTRAPVNAPRFLPVENIENLPDFGDDPLRAVTRLPGTSTGGFTAKSNIRGGEVDETLIRFDGLRLRDPFHLKDFQSVFSAIDPAIIRGMDVYTGGVPVSYGDRMSGVIDISSIEAPPATYHEIAQTFFNSSVLSTGSIDDGRVDWVVAARRGNLDLLLDVADPDLGDPSYVDAYARMGIQVTDSLRVTGNVLVFDDDIRLSDSDDEEDAKASYHDRYYWVRFDQDLGNDLAGRTIFAHTDISMDRDGGIVREGVSTGRLDDERSFTIDSVQTDWSWQLSDRWLLEFGAESGYQDGSYDYMDEADFDVLFLTPGAATDPERRIEVHVDPDGSYYGAYANGRVGLTDRLTFDLGLRWDRQTLTDDNEDLFSPRIGAVYSLGDRSILRAGWGRHYQSQGIDELQASDGVTEYSRAQRADHLVVGFQHQMRNGIEFRLEGYDKDMDRLRPRFENILNTKILMPELQPDRVRIDPSGAKARGIEVSIADPYNEPVSWWLSYTWSTVKDELPEGNVRRAWDQQAAAQGGLEWRRGPWILNLAGTYSSGWPTTDGEIVETDPIPLVATGARNSKRLDHYFSLDVRISRDWKLPASYLTTFFEVTNLTGRFNQCCVDYDVEVEDGEAEIDFDPENYLRAFPSLGVVWRFGKGRAYAP